ncbi:hypothetical protein BGW80DRAFT_1463970 [Lactifluus volemus]|nr:hypothetical protein BGW80DRAFT_1463970 [Lactifluus volemus]
MSIFSFRTGSATAFVSFFYLAIFTSLYLTQYGPSLPTLQKQNELGMSIADLPHPYNSRQNDYVRNFVLGRLQQTKKERDFIHVDDDINTNAVFLDGSRAVYFQGTNILVKVDGTDNMTNNDGVLFSAHFDSVSTAPGATDDGMSVAALIQMVTFLSNNRPRRTAVFNINNGEEDGLHGAHAFLHHPWSNLTSTFLNFDGAGSGGRPFLFRTTSYDILKDFRAAPHIHADAISQDAWDQGVIRSDTDYSVYSAPRTPSGMQGADIAFYHARSRYHTMDDSIRGMGYDGAGARRSLWALMELLRTVGNSVLNSQSESGAGDEKEKAVYFELFGVYLVAFRFRTLLVVEMVLVAIGIILASSLSPNDSSNFFRGYGRFLLALILGTGAQVGLVVGFLRLNPKSTVHAHPIATSIAAFTLLICPWPFLFKAANVYVPFPLASSELSFDRTLRAHLGSPSRHIDPDTTTATPILFERRLWGISRQVDTAELRQEETEDSETMPLLPESDRPTDSGGTGGESLTIFTTWIGAMPQTIPDGGSVGIVYAPISILAFLIVLPSAPFIHKIHRALTVVAFVYFAHEVELTNLTATIPHPRLTRAVAQINVIEGYGSRLATTLPSSWRDADLKDSNVQSLYPSIPGAGEDKGAWLVANATRLGPISLRVEIEGVETRSCRIYVDSHAIRRYRARTRQGSSSGEKTESSADVAWSTFEVPHGVEIHLLTLWSRTWGSRFEVELDVNDDESAADSQGEGSRDGYHGAHIPALEEARMFLPEWVAISKATDGLVEAISGFVL